eukprot:3148948-Karenia_brevis.AAC.1
MKTLLDYHYDDCHEESWRLANINSSRKHAPKRKSDEKIFRSVLDKKHQRKTKHVALPDNIKVILRKKADEQSWEKLERLRIEIASELRWLAQVAPDTTTDAMGQAVLNSPDTLQRISETWME